MTNREYLRYCTDEEFAELVCAAIGEFEDDNYHSDLDIIDIVDAVIFDFEEWLSKKYKG